MWRGLTHAQLKLNHKSYTQQVTLETFTGQEAYEKGRCDQMLVLVWLHCISKVIDLDD